MNESPCTCCGQVRPYPTEPGEWEYSELIYMPSGKQFWQRVTIKKPDANDRDGQDGLRVWKDGEMIWWPHNAAWRKIQ
jgi:hypothetical protein